MEQQQTSFIRAFFAVAFSVTALVAMLVLMAVRYGRALLVDELGHTMGMTRAMLLMNAFPLFYWPITFVVLFVLSRRLGSADGAAARPSIRPFIIFSILYSYSVWLSVSLVSALIGAVTNAIDISSDAYWILPVVPDLVRSSLIVALFPVLVWLVSQAHDRNGPSLGAILALLTKDSPGIYVGYAGLYLFGSILPRLVVAMQMGSGVWLTGYAVFGLLGMLEPFLSLVFSVATYRVAASRRSSGNAFS